MKLSKLFVASVLALSIPASASSGDKGGNGGDPNEIVFKEIALNIKQWILSGNADTLKLPAGVELKTYKAKMLAVLTDYHISFSNDVVRVKGLEKTCRNEGYPRPDRIECNITRYSQARLSSVDDVYRLVHHELASLAELELNNGLDSDYTISTQVAARLEVESVKRLPIVRQPNQIQKPKTRLEEIANMFVAGADLVQTDFLGAYAGRCFTSVESEGVDFDTPTGALLVGSTYPQDDAGPAFPKAHRISATIINALGENPFYRFDNWTSSRAVSYLQSQSPINSSSVTNLKGTQVWSSDYPNGVKALFRARRYGQNIVTLASETTSQGNRGWVACYFYKKLR